MLSATLRIANLVKCSMFTAVTPISEESDGDKHTRYFGVYIVFCALFLCLVMAKKVFLMGEKFQSVGFVSCIMVDAPRRLMGEAIRRGCRPSDIVLPDKSDGWQHTHTM